MATKWRQIRYGNLLKRSDLLWKNTSEKTSRKSSSALYVKTLSRRLSWKSSKDFLRSENPDYSKAFKWLQNIGKFQNKVRALRNKKSFLKVRALSNKWLPNEEKSEMETYQNAQICYERGDKGEDSTIRLPRRLRGSLPSLSHIWKTYIFRSIQMASKQRKTSKIR